MPGNKKVYAVFGAQNPSDLDTRVQAVFATTATRQLGSGNWLVADDAAGPSAFYEKLKSKGDIDCVVTPVDSYYGFKDKAVWEWISTATK